MKKVISLVGSLLILAFPLISYGFPSSHVISHGASQPRQFDWYGGPKYNHEVMEGRTLTEISEIASHQATFYNLPVEYKTENGGMVVKAYPNYGKSKDCASVQEEAWKEARLISSRIEKVCVPSYGMEKLIY